MLNADSVGGISGFSATLSIFRLRDNMRAKNRFRPFAKLFFALPFNPNTRQEKKPIRDPPLISGRLFCPVF